MGRPLALVQLLGLSAALAAMLAPAPLRILLRWPDLTIYPVWSPVLLVLAGGIAAASIASSEERLQPAGTCFVGVLAAQVGALGVWAHQHWRPAFGMGGGYAGEEAQLQRWAIVVAAGGVLASLAAVAQLIARRDWPRAGRRPGRRTRVVTGAGILVGLPLLMSRMDRDLSDLTSLVALGIVYSVPWGAALVASGWMRAAGTTGVLVACLASAVASAAAPSWHLSGSPGRVVFSVAAAGFLVLLLRDLRKSP